jgi:hypothetical protein
MGETIGVGAQIVLPFFGSLAGDSKIDQFSHAAPRWWPDTSAPTF